MHEIRAVLFDLGDVLMMEETEVKDADGVTLEADLRKGAVDVLRLLKDEGYAIGLVADTRIGTYQNVLKQHGVYDVFDTFAISEELGWTKPDRRIFAKALSDLGITSDAYAQVIMIGNNLRRDIAGAKRLGLITIWTHWNDRYPTTAEHPDEEADFVIGPLSELFPLIRRIEAGFKAGQGAAELQSQAAAARQDSEVETRRDADEDEE